MIKMYKNNGIKFYPLSDLGAPTGTTFETIPYATQGTDGRPAECYQQPVRFDDQSRVQVGTTYSEVFVEVYSSTGATIYSATVATTTTMDGLNVANIVLDWTSIVGADNGTTVFVYDDDTDSGWKSEPLCHPPGRLLKIVYANNNNHSDWGNYEDCWEMIAYAPAAMFPVGFATAGTDFQDSRGHVLRLNQTIRSNFLMQVEHAPFYLHNILLYALRHDEVFIRQTMTSNVVVYEQYVIPPNTDYAPRLDDRYSLMRAELELWEMDGMTRRITAPVSLFGLGAPVLLPESNMSGGGFQANWEPLLDADYYEVEISTDSTFATGTTYTTSNTFYAFTGLTTCELYYYRVRGVSCEGIGSWASNQTEHSDSIHFRGLQNWNVIEKDEKITGLVFEDLLTMATGLIYKYAPVHAVPDWSIYAALTLPQLQAEIDAGGSVYTIYVEVVAYASAMDEAVILAKYTSPSFYLKLACLSYGFKVPNTVSQDLYLAFDRQCQIDDVFAINGSSVAFSVITSTAGDFTSFPFNRAGANLELAVTSPPFLLGVHATPPLAIGEDIVTITITQ